MAINITLVCDRCSKETSVLWSVGVTCERTGPDIRERYYMPNKRQAADWCDDCVKEMGVIRPLIKADETSIPTTMEDIVKQIVEQANGRSEE